MKINQDKTSFTSLANVNLSSIKKHMPRQESNIFQAVIALAHNPNRDELVIEAVSPEVIKLEHIGEKGQRQFSSVVDIRKTLSLLKFQVLEKYFDKAEGGINPQTRAELVNVFEREIDAINKYPFDFANAILAEYTKLSKNTGIKEPVIK